ncbi:hypothetical protein [Xanthomonas oryzae]|uniref:DUF3995 domain-containing protein n=1 Tax=Xanthomonas oryzae pv. leersiae TaxID=3112258 RepID=A0AAJ6H1G7_9XANT|nr:hypothetical protein [Xanthomonas oryzae]QBG96613.1 hypothetical protein EYC55_15920 [Xanthomonas oryzae]QBG99318.1 hypothetical protein EYC56_07970 [Xanthomonas oryzae]UNE63898.1 hypothetical protein MML47_06865 [Xanthomonas oryzae]WIX07836.1 hypothetical protein QN060_07360 [Xanthomonas oryzae pv. oryzae]
MEDNHNWALIVAACCSFLASLVHLGCIWFGPSWYRALGAGEGMAQMAAAGHWYPSVITFTIAAVLAAWGAYALSGAGVLPRLPLLRITLCAITAVYLLRGFALVPMQIWMPGRSNSFWLWSSFICLTIGVFHIVGLRQIWIKL